MRKKLLDIKKIYAGSQTAQHVNSAYVNVKLSNFLHNVSFGTLPQPTDVKCSISRTSGITGRYAALARSYSPLWYAFRSLFKSQFHIETVTDFIMCNPI